jgi:hypothetical protein
MRVIMQPCEKLSKVFKGRLQVYDEKGKHADWGIYQNFICNIGGHCHLLRLFFYRRQYQDFDTIKINQNGLCWQVGPNLSPLHTQKIEELHKLRNADTKVYLSSLERQKMFSFHLLLVI